MSWSRRSPSRVWRMSGGMHKMGKPSRDKGLRVEREIVNRLKDVGIPAERVPLSGAAGGKFVGDVVIETRLGERCAEVKARKNGEGFSTLEGWLGSNDLLILKRNNKEPFVVMPWAQYVELITP